MTIDTIKLQGPPYLPFLNTEAIKFLESILLPHFEVFEYGSGGSTIFLAQRVRKVISVEDSRLFLAEIQHLLKHLNLMNVELVFVDNVYISEKALGAYVQTIDKYPDGTFDLIICDGADNSRGQLPSRAKPKVKPGGWLLVDDVGWDPVTRGIEIAELNDWPRTVCTGQVVGMIPGISTGPGDSQAAFYRCPL